MAEEAFQRLPKVMDCPYHHCKPAYSPQVLCQGRPSELVIHRWLCPACQLQNPTPKKWNTFGEGFTSQYTKAAALANWNKAVHRRQMRMLKDAIKNG